MFLILFIYSETVNSKNKTGQSKMHKWKTGYFQIVQAAPVETGKDNTMEQMINQNDTLWIKAVLLNLNNVCKLYLYDMRMSSLVTLPSFNFRADLKVCIKKSVDSLHTN